MNGTARCVYETPCGWCSKWDKECDKKKYKPKGEVITKIDEATFTDEAKLACEIDSDHKWEWRGYDGMHSHYRCTKCGDVKIE